MRNSRSHAWRGNAAGTLRVPFAEEQIPESTEKNWWDSSTGNLLTSKPEYKKSEVRNKCPKT